MGLGTVGFAIDPASGSFGDREGGTTLRDRHLCCLVAQADARQWVAVTERGPSFANGINIQIPDGFDFSNADTVIYARALYKPRTPEIKSLDMLIKNDREEFVSRDPNMVVTEVKAPRTGDGRALKSFTFFPKNTGNWEQVSYGEEADYYLIFTISSRSRAGFTKMFSIYEQYIGRYKEGP